MSEHVPDGVDVAPMLELSLPEVGQARILVAVHRPEATPPLRAEIWTFDQNNPEQRLLPTEQTGPVLRLTADEQPAKELAELRRQLAAPGSVVHRPIGHDVDPPARIIDQLSRHARSVRDPLASAQARVDALADFVRGLDDSLVFERDRAGEILKRLAHDGVDAASTAAASDRRGSVAVTVGATTYGATIMRKSGGWVLVSME